MAEVDPKLTALVDQIAASDGDPQYRDETPAQRKARHQEMVLGYMIANKSTLNAAAETRAANRGPTSFAPFMLVTYLAVFGICAVLCQLYYTSKEASGVNLGALAVFGAIAALGILGFLRRRSELHSSDITRKSFQGVVIAACLGLLASGGLHKMLVL